MSFVALGIGRVEYWKTARRFTKFVEPYTFGFHMFAPWPASRRLRWPFGRRGASVFDGWFCTREQMVKGALPEMNTRAEECRKVPPPWETDGKSLLRLMLDAFDRESEWKELAYPVTNPRIVFAPSGEVMA